MSLQIIIQEVRLFGKILSKQVPQNQQIQQLRRFRINLGQTTYISQNYGQFISQNQLVFDQSFSFYYDNHSLLLEVEIFKQHQFMDNSDLEQILFGQIDLSDLTNIIGERIQTNFMNIKNQAVGKLTMIIEVFKSGPKFIQKVTSKILFQTVNQEKKKQTQVSKAGKNIKKLMVNNSLTNTLMTINYLEVKPDKQDTQIFNRQCFIMIRYGFQVNAFSKILKVILKDNISWNDYLEFMKNEDVKFQFFFLFYDDLGSIICKAKGQIKYIVFDQTINNHQITLFDKRSNIYGDIYIKFIQKQVQIIKIKNNVQKKLKQASQQINNAIEIFNKFKFQNQNNNRILSEKLRQIQLRKIQEQEEKMKPLDQSEKKKRQEDSKFIQFMQKQVIKIDRQLKKKQINQKKLERKQAFKRNPNLDRIGTSKNSKFNQSLSSLQFKSQMKEDITIIDQIQEQKVITQQVNQQNQS